jgi:uroporphyrin-III C-methyltransferase
MARAFPNDGARTAWTGDIDPSDRDGLLALLLQARQQQGAASAAAAAPCAATTTGANAAAADPTPSGRVYLVGTGPGDPGLLTLRAVQLLQRADVVLYDRLVSDDVLSLASSSALLVYAGKAAGLHTRPQEEIHHLLAAFAQAGATVVRLKGGDPFVFGRGGEEAAYLQAQGVEVRAVPGVTAAAGIAAELGIPLTHRGVATGVRFLTGHAREGGEAQLEETVEAMLGGGGGGVEGEENGEGSGGSGADQHTTLVVYMGLGTLPALTARLTGAAQPSTTEAAGGLQEATAMAAAAATAGAPSSRQQRRRRFYAPSTPAVAVERGTTDDQRVVFGTLADLSERATAAGLRSPTLIVVGSVVGLSPQWQAWEAEGRPLPAPASAAAAGQVPCARSELGDPLRELGLIKGGVAEREAAAVARPREGAAAAAV